MKPQPLTPVRVVVAVVYDVVNRESFTTYADLIESVKRACARVKLRYDSATVHAAIEQVERAGRQCVTLPPPPTATDPPAITPLSPSEASDILARLRKKLASDDPAPNPMPTPAPVADPLHQRFRRDRVKAAAIVAAEIVASIDRCEALERAIFQENPPAPADREPA